MKKSAIILMGALIGLVAIGALVSGKAVLLVWLLVPLAGFCLAFLNDLISIAFKTANREPPMDESMEEHIEHYRDYVPVDPGDMPHSPR